MPRQPEGGHLFLQQHQQLAPIQFHNQLRLADEPS
jgi:hypothetical protein